MPIIRKQWTEQWKPASTMWGIGVLFGLNMYRYDFVGLLMHAEHLEAAMGVGPPYHQRASYPSLQMILTRKILKMQSAMKFFEKIVAVLRIAVPYTGMIISTRGISKTRERVLDLGVSQLSGGSRTSVGGYAEEEPEEENSAQFDLNDTRTLDQIVKLVVDGGFIPSFCTACYREGRTGDRLCSL